jgi:hypothetical protein
MAKEAEEKRLFGGEGGRVFILLESRQQWLGESGKGCCLVLPLLIKRDHFHRRRSCLLNSDLNVELFQF